LFGEWIWEPGAYPQRVFEEAGDTTAGSDGRTLVFQKGNSLWKADTVGGPQTELVSGDAWNPTITPDNRWVIFVSSRTGLQSPWIVSIDGGEPRQLVNIYAAGPGVDVSPDGRFIVFASRDEKRGGGVVVTCELDSCRERRTFRISGQVVRVRWTPDGRAFNYVDATTQRDLWTMPVAGGAPTQLTHFDDRVIVDYDWAPDGKRLAMARRLETNDIVMLQGLHRDTR
jgi:Tol biopolymer transport system component